MWWGCESILNDLVPLMSKLPTYKDGRKVEGPGYVTIQMASNGS